MRRSGDLYLAHRRAIDQAIRAVSKRHRMRAEDAEDFASQVSIHLIQGDSAVLRRFQGRSRISTYILTVVTHFAQDWRNARWGKWRPSAEARRQGPVAVHLERLMRRDGLKFEEAFETLRLNFGVTTSRAELTDMLVPLRGFGRPRIVADDLLEIRPAIQPGPDDLAAARASAAAANVAFSRLAAAIAALPPEEAHLLKMRYEDGLPVVEIARSLGTEAKPLYRRIERLLRQIRNELETQGIDASAVRDLLVRQPFAALLDNECCAIGRLRLFPVEEQLGQVISQVA